MTIADLSKVYSGNVVITVKGYHKATGDYYSFFTYTDNPIKLIDIEAGNYVFDLPILGMYIYNDILYIDVRQWV